MIWTWPLEYFSSGFTNGHASRWTLTPRNKAKRSQNYLPLTFFFLFLYHSCFITKLDDDDVLRNHHDEWCLHVFKSSLFSTYSVYSAIVFWSTIRCFVKLSSLISSPVIFNTYALQTIAHIYKYDARTVCIIIPYSPDGQFTHTPGNRQLILILSYPIFHWNLWSNLLGFHLRCTFHKFSLSVNLKSTSLI